MTACQDNGPESRGKRTQFLHRMVQFADQIGTPTHLLYYPPCHSTYNPIERCWGILALHWHRTKLVDVTTMLVERFVNSYEVTVASVGSSF
jgi:DDE family transposase